MKIARCCPICKNEECEHLLTRKAEYPGSDLQSNLLDINYIRNYILFDRILHSRNPFEAHFQICTNCGFIFFYPRPEESDMATKYDMVNELGDSKQREASLYHGITCDDKRAFEIHKFVTSFANVRNSNVIDVGGARGLNLKYFLDDNNCHVVDYERHKLLAVIQYLCETTEDVPKSTLAKVVLYCHTLEHVVDPVKEVLRIKDILEPGGLLYIEVPFGCWNEYKHAKNFLTHINFFSEGSLYYLLDMCGLSIRYLRLKPTLSRVKYVPVIVAIAENSPPHNEKIDAYRVTRSQMEGKHYFLRARQAFLTAKLMKFKLFLAAYRQYQFRRQIRRSRNICLTSPQHLPYAQNTLSEKFPGEDVQLTTLTLATDVRGFLSHNFRRYDKAIFFTYDLDMQIFPLPLTLILLWLSRKGAYFIDMQGRVEQTRYHTLFFRYLPSLFVEIASALFVILKVKGDIRRLEKSTLPLIEQYSKENGNKFKIAYLRTEQSFGTISGGSVAHIQGVAEGFSALGHSLFIISTDKLTMLDRRTPLYIIKPRGTLRNLPNLLEMEYSRYLVKKASEIFEEEQPTVIYQRNSLNNYAGATLARKFSLPFILEYNSPLLWMARHWGRHQSFERIANDIELLNLRAANLIVVVSKPLKELLVARGVPEDKILVDPNGVNPERFRPDISGFKIRHRYGLEERIVVGFIGTFAKWQGLEILAKAAVKIINELNMERQIYFLFIGDGAMLPETKRIVQEGSIKDKVTFTGMVPQAQAVEYLAACDILVNPTLPNPDGTEFFGSPTKLFEYMAMGKGIVASKVGQIGEILSHEETAILTEPGNVEQLARGILWLAENKELREKLGKRAREVITTEYTWDQNVARVIKALNDLGVKS